jgi:pimeloyl-[acyl-carrier protein] methyl ester esterase
LIRLVAKNRDLMKDIILNQYPRPMKEGYLDNGVYYRHNDLRANRPALVFVHGFSGSSSAWFGYETELGQDYNLVFFDWRGHGKSKKSRNCRDYAIEKISQDLLDLLDKLQISEVIIISHSYGSLIALGFFSKRPPAVRGFAFLSPDNRVGEPLWIKIGEFLLSNIPSIFFRPFDRDCGAHLDYSRLPTGDWSFKRILADIGNTTFRVYCYYFKRINEFNVEKILANINAPVLIIHGAKDTIFPAKNSVFMAKKIKNARLEILPGANHILVLNNVPEIIKEVGDFSRKVWLEQIQ